MSLSAKPSSAAVPAAGTTPWKPVLVRAFVALAFGSLTIFWTEPSVQVLAWSVAAYLIATASSVFASKALPAAVPAIAALCGVAAAVTQSDAGVAASAALGLLVLGAAELVVGIRRRQHTLSRDWLISGVIGVGTAAALPFFVGLGAHALLGVAGGGAVLSGVLWVLSGLSARHDGRTAAAEAVN